MTRWKQEENRGSIPRLVMVSLPNYDGPLPSVGVTLGQVQGDTRDHLQGNQE